MHILEYLAFFLLAVFTGFNPVVRPVFSYVKERGW